MNSIHSCMSAPTPFNKTIAGFISILAITALAIAIIGLAAAGGGPLKAIVQFGMPAHVALLGTSLILLILDLVWIKTLCKQNPSGPRSESPQATPMPPPLFVNKAVLEPSVETSSEAEVSAELSVTTFEQLHVEIKMECFSYLTPSELGRCLQVSKVWNRLANQETLWNAFDLRQL